MACGYELTTLVPEREDYASIQSQAIKDLLLFIFRRDKQGNFLATVEQVRTTTSFCRQLTLDLATVNLDLEQVALALPTVD